MKQFFKIPIVIGLLFATFCFAEENEFGFDISARSKSKEENKNDIDMQDWQSKSDSSLCYEPRCGCDKDYRRCCFGLPLPVKCGWAFVEGEYLYWKAYTVVPYADFKFNVAPFNFSSDEPYSSDIKTVSMSGASGYRVTLGVYFNNCSYGTAQFRYFATDGSDSFSAPANDAVQLSRRDSFNNPWDMYGIVTNTVALPFSVSAKQRHREKILDFDYNKLFTCGRYSMTPYMGVRFAWVKSDLSINYIRINPAEDQPPTISRSAHVDINKHMNLGVGLHSGFNTHSDLCWGFGAYTTSSVSILVGQFQRRLREEMFSDTTGATRATVTSGYKVTDFQTNYQLGLGLDWGKHFCKCCYYLGLKIGYEANVWPNFFDVFEVATGAIDTRTSPIVNYYSRSLLTHGLNVGARFDF